MSKLCLLLGVLALLACRMALAEPCPSSFPLNPPADKAALTAAMQQLKGQEDACQNRADYYNYRGLVALQQGDARGAAEWLERALLLNPDLAGVQVDYLRALALAGDQASAANLAQSLLARSDLPPTVAAWLPRQYQDWRSSEAWITRFSIAVLGGYETNLNGAPQNPFVTLTLGSGNLLLQLAPQFQAKGGSAGQVVFSGVAGKDTGSDAFVLIGQAQTRNGADSSTNFQQVDLGGVWRHALGDNGTLLRGDTISLRYGGQQLYQSLRLEPGFEWGGKVCSPRLGMLYNAYTYPVSHELDGRYLGGVAGLACAVGVNQLRGQVSAGHDQAAYTDRPGGNEQVRELTLGWHRPLGAGSMDLEGILGGMQDASGYSSLLANGASRTVNRQYLRLEYDHPITGQWEGLVYGELNRQDSNVSLFSVTDRAIYAGLRWKTP